MTNIQQIEIIQITPEKLESIIEIAIKKGVEQARNIFSKPSIQEEYLTRKEAAKKLKISIGTLYNWTKSGKLPSHKIDRKVLYKETEIKEFINKASL
ncbi:helix-turn-helix domain-containing protein [Chryseobacterium sp.]|uniref:helix-turn-helix domain-containing protein n=1 Tax=Chryseobacterium sp. TaxID=1871047 RepID=UPI002896612B|nr:helix-turn-helix domain-containing protein [Chryseobacterium sp.]